MNAETLGRRVRAYTATAGVCWCGYDSEDMLGAGVIDHIVHSLIDDNALTIEVSFDA